MGSNRRDTLLKIGERLFSEHGYRDVSIKDITAAAGLGMGSFYTYFSAKEAFYSEILDGIEKRGVRDVEKHVNSLRSPLFRLKALFRYTILSLRSNEILRGIYTREKRYMYPGAEERSQQGNTLFSRVESSSGRSWTKAPVAVSSARAFSGTPSGCSLPSSQRSRSTAEHPRHWTWPTT